MDYLLKFNVEHFQVRKGRLATLANRDLRVRKRSNNVGTVLSKISIKGLRGQMGLPGREGKRGKSNSYVRTKSAY